MHPAKKGQTREGLTLTRPLDCAPVDGAREGGCACGAVRYRLRSDPLFVHCCHCLNCQRQTGSAFVINLLIEAERVELLSGDPHPVDAPRDDGSADAVDRELAGLVDGRYIRLQPRLDDASDALDDASAENVTALRRVAERLIADRSADIDRICALVAA